MCAPCRERLATVKPANGRKAVTRPRGKAGRVGRNKRRSGVNFVVKDGA